MINSKDISVVVQGAVDKVNTPLCLKSIRKYLPDAEVILSTWEGSSVDGLDYDVLILNNDPGGFRMSPFEINNVKRQITSTLQGLKRAVKKYAFKIRSDMELTGDNFLDYFDKFNSYNQEWHFLERRIIIPSLITRDPRVWESPMCPSDWCSFGLTSDMLRLWDIDFPTEEEQQWFKYHKKDKLVKRYYYQLEARFNPEQFIWVNFIKKYKPDLHTDNMFDVNEDSINETLLSYANNLIILSVKQFGINFLKPGRENSDRWHILTHNDFLRIYNKYAGGNATICVIDMEKILHLKYFRQSNSRLFHIAKRDSFVREFLIKEIQYVFPFYFSFVNP